MAEEKRTVTVEVEGIELTIDMDAIEDLDTLDMLDEIQGGNVFKLKKLMVAVLGDEGWKAAKSHLAGDSGRVTASAASEFIGAVFEAVGAKN